MADTPIGKIKGYLAYAKLAEAGKKYKKDDEFEYSIDIIVTEDEADQWDEEFPKQASKKVKVANFEEEFKFPVPEALQDSKYVYRIKLKQPVKEDPDLDAKYRPRVFIQSTEDGSKIRTDITLSRLIANGSYGTVSYRNIKNDFGDFAYLQNVLILEENFKEFISTSGKKAGSEFDDEDDAPVVVRKEKENKAATEARASKEKEAVKEDAPPAKPAKTTKKTPKPSVDAVDVEEDSPF